MRAEILSIGTEILLGHIVDTNAAYLAQQLAPLGIDLYFVSQVGDNQGRVTETLRRAWDRADIIITTGGLGPTEDDVTREAISALVNETPEVDATLEAELRAKFAAFGARMPERNVKQAWLIPSSTTLPNPVGTAPGWFVQKDRRIIISMPGVPHEMVRMWESEAVPRITGLSGETLFTRILRVAGLGESAVEERISDLIHQTNPTAATYAKADAVDVRITAKAATAAEGEAMVAAVEEEARQKLGNHVFGTDKETLSGVAGKLLQQRGWQIATMESCTGGMLANILTDVPGSSNYMRGGIVSYATDIKVAMGVPQETIDTYGVISEETALAMAAAACQQLGSQVGVGITGVAGPD
ncbi:MAG TPA: competence/damage-inducible protein A, partial [Ktedonobacterales bacterium]|nr:competence/damage-inducible protein A [Ktedonobacterales bacterium]